MERGVLAFIRKLPLLGGLFPAGLEKNAEPVGEDSYRVGYAIRNINPWINNDPAQGFRSGLFIMAGNDASNPKYTANRLFDDNGDGVVDENDGLFTTATAVTDSFHNTVLYLTIDAVRAHPMVTTAVKKAIVSALGDDVISADRIFLSANHTHSGPPFDKLSDGTEEQVAYYNWVIEQIKEAAVEAYLDRAPAKMSKGTVNAKEATAALGYNGGDGYHMNAIRHYEVTLTEIFGEEKRVSKYLTGSGDAVRSSAESSAKEYRVVENADNNMHVLLFEFADDVEKKSVVFVNWRAHCTMNSGAIPDALSSDYANGLRTTLLKAGYRAAFFQGASGNVVAVAREKSWPIMPETKDWVEHVENTASTGQPVNEYKAFVYGSMLADIAKYCLGTSGKMQKCSAGKIRTMQLMWHGEMQKDSPGLQKAAQHTKELEAEKTAFKYPYTYNGYTVNARLHRNAILTRKSASPEFADLELNAILLGDNVAFVTAPNELVDKYYEYAAGEKYQFNKNSWNDLMDEATYGTPFVLGYTNDHRGYIGSWLHHTANSAAYYEITGYAQDGDKHLSPGTYEAYISRFAQGQGEALIKQFGAMLNHLKSS